MAPKDSSSKAPVPVPQESADMIARRGKILAELEKQVTSASGTVKACMLKSIQVLKSMEPAVQLDERLYQDFTGAFMRLAKEQANTAPPEIFMTLIEYMQERITALSPQFVATAAAHDMKAPAIKVPEGAAPAAAPPPAAAAPAAAKGAKDGFESSGKAKKMSLGGDEAPAAPAASRDAEKKEELESFKTWMKNPGLGKMKG